MKPKKEIDAYHLHAVYLYVNNLKEGLPEDKAKVNAIFDARQLLNKTMLDKLTEKEPLIIRTASFAKLSNGSLICDGSYDRDIIEHVGVPYYFLILLPIVKRAIQSGLSFIDIKNGFVSTLNKTEMRPIR